MHCIDYGQKSWSFLKCVSTGELMGLRLHHLSKASQHKLIVSAIWGVPPLLNKLPPFACLQLMHAQICTHQREGRRTVHYFYSYQLREHERIGLCCPIQQEIGDFPQVPVALQRILEQGCPIYGLWARLSPSMALIRPKSKWSEGGKVGGYGGTSKHMLQLPFSR